MGISKVGGFGANGSGDIFLAYSTANQGAGKEGGARDVEMLPNEELNDFFEATVFAVEEAIVNALIMAETMEGRDNNKVFALPHDRLLGILEKYNRLHS